jgi:trk system potassium uptake protein
MVFIGGHLGFKGLMAASEEESLPGGSGDLLRLFRNIALATFHARAGRRRGDTYGVPDGYGLGSAGRPGLAGFHSISAFCTGGFFTFPEGLSTYASSFTVNLVFVSLIVAGGPGFPVLVNLYRYPRVRRLSLHSKLVYTMYVILSPASVLTFATRA